MPPAQERLISSRRWWRPQPASVGSARYIVAVALIGAALLLRYALRNWLGPNVPYLQFFPAILIAAWYGGLGPGVVATATASLAAMYFFLPPAGLAVGQPGDLVSLSLFVATGLGVAWTNHQLRTAERARRAEAALATERAERLDAIINTTVDGIIVIDSTGTIEAFNRGAERLFGYPASEAIGRNVNMLMPSPDHEEHDAYLGRYLDTGIATIIGSGRQVTGRRRDGTTFPLHLSVGEMSVRGERKFTGMLHDLSERMRLDEQLRASEARWRSVIDSAADGIVVIDAHGRIEAFNPAAERLFGYPEGDVIGRNVNVLMPSPYHEEHDTYLARHLATGVQKIIGTGREVTGLRRDGTTFPLHLSVGKMTGDGEQRFTGILHDFSARVRIEKQLREQTSLAKLGEMAAVIAHEVKNPLAGVRAAIQIIGTRLPKDSKDAPIVGEIVSRIDALNELMKDLLLFARPPQPKLALVDMETLVMSTAHLLRGDPAFGQVEVKVDGEPARVLADAELLKIVFVNLLVNAAHAMLGRGTIQVSLTSIADMCQIVFTDEGPGIPADVLERSSPRSSPPKLADPVWGCRRCGASSRLTKARSASRVHQRAEQS